MTGIRLRKLPLVIAVPIVVALLMALVGAVASISVLDRLGSNQQSEVERLIAGIGSSLSAALSASVAQHDVWSAFDLIDRVVQGEAELPLSYVIAIDESGQILAASRPLDFPVGSRLPDAVAALRLADDVAMTGDTGTVGRLIPLVQGGRQVGELAIAFETAQFVAERREVLITLVVVNAVLTIFMAFAGYVVTRRMLAPASTFIREIEASIDDHLRPVPEATISGAPPDYARLFRRFNAIAAAARDRERMAEQLAKEEKAALVGKVAAAMAHEVNNPLGGLLNAVGTLETHGSDPSVRQECTGMLRRGLNGIREVVGATLVTWRRDHDPATLTGGAIDDLRSLIAPQIRRKKLSLDWANALDGSAPLPSGVVRQVILNLLINAANATPIGGRVSLTCQSIESGLLIRISDSGRGLPAEWIRFLTQADRLAALPDSGSLGLWTVRELVSRHGGSISVDRGSAGTQVTVIFPTGSVNRDVAA